MLAANKRHEPQNTAMPAGSVIAKYIRLSLDDGITESLSIPNQHMLLDAHIDELEIPNATVIEFVDNGYTGTNMERPALQEMLDLVRSGRINCIVVKDFSRFSRNALESGYYIEQIFPLYRIRFISVSDRFDSNDYMNDTGGIDVAFKFLMHEYYSQDLSKKVKSAKRIKMARGENIVATAIYGYRKNDVGKWEPEPRSANVVRKIFELALQGLPPSIVKVRLFEAGEPTPREHIELMRDKKIVPKCHWETRKVAEILRNDQYIGTYVSGKQVSKAVGSSNKIVTPQSEWFKFPNSHPPIISKVIFDEVQTLMDCRLFGKATVQSHEGTWKDEAVQSSKRQRMLSGDIVAATAVYGYSKQEGGAWTIDESAAKTIREIFGLARKRISPQEIAGTLKDSGCPMPREHIELAAGKQITPTFNWRAKHVRNILKNIQYTGAYVSGRILTDAKTGKKYRPPQEDWVVIPNKNPAIVSKELFDEVQAILAEETKLRKKNKKPRNYLLRSKVRCGCCDSAMAYDPITSPVFRCYQTAADSTAPCYKLKVVVSELDEAVLTIIRKQAEVILNNGDLTVLRKTGCSTQQVADYENQLNSLVAQRQKLYEQFITGEIDRQTHQSLKAECSAQIEQLNERLNLHRQAQHDSQNVQRTADFAKTVFAETITSQEIVDMLIEKIHVFPDNNIEVTWKVSGFAAAVK
ncbi:MAG: recombinase family protein [Defluviitaleaceae bacterium]|nr:recombinase family protein [Defluviitaleaceae bacterium]